MDISKAEKLRKSLIPKTGFNVVAIDDHELPWEALYLVGHFENKNDAKKAQVEKLKKGIKSYIYTPETN